MDIPGFTCKQSGDCCRKRRIPVTLVEIERLAQYRSIALPAFFEQYLSAATVGNETVLLLGKAEDGWCVFNSEDKRCGVHSVKPSACALFLCLEALKSREGYAWSLLFGNEEGRRYIARRSVAQEITTQYVQAHGAQWDEKAFYEGIAEIEERQATLARQTLRAARQADDTTGFISFECPACKVRSSCCTDRPLTLDDIRAIAEYKNLSIEDCFTKYVAEEASEKSQGMLALKRAEAEGACVFLDRENNCCSILACQPAYCRFIVCPLYQLDSDMHARYFFGAGDLEEQFRHSLAVEVTQRYIAQHGYKPDLQGITRHIQLLDELLKQETLYDEFCASVALFRYAQEPELVPRNVQDTPA